ncbi:hypothetical protein GW17_00017297 [Ensete ventricosum]|nr:hypothetical protein GW17_00017297 [Ensete ventricosum]
MPWPHTRSPPPSPRSEPSPALNDRRAEEFPMWRRRKSRPGMGMRTASVASHTEAEKPPPLLYPQTEAILLDLVSRFVLVWSEAIHTWRWQSLYGTSLAGLRRSHRRPLLVLDPSRFLLIPSDSPPILSLRSFIPRCSPSPALFSGLRGPSEDSIRFSTLLLMILSAVVRLHLLPDENPLIHNKQGIVTFQVGGSGNQSSEDPVSQKASTWAEPLLDFVATNFLPLGRSFYLFCCLRL